MGSGTLEVTGRLLDASNASFVAQIPGAGDAAPLTCVYKPVRGERPLWDFPDGTLAAREVASYLVSEAGGWHVVPPTTLGDGPLGAGMLQAWVEVTEPAAPVAVLPADTEVPGWMPVLDALDAEDNPVVLAHRDSAALRSVAVFDVVVNNADRKGAHLLPVGDHPYAVLGCDHGLTFHTEPKLRTVLWGWAGEPLGTDDLDRLQRLHAALDGTLRAELDPLLAPDELTALRRRLDRLLTTGSMPLPDPMRPAIPWPPL
ncbi:UNVERIFIED_CONTAM: phosphatidylinositol kinase [Mumia flava]